MRGRSSAGLLILIGLFCVSAILEVSLGSLRIPFDHILPDTWAYFHGGRSPEAVVIGAIRWPRFWVAAFVGAGLATTGAVLQAVFRNSMADPAIIGVSSGAALGAVAVIRLLAGNPKRASMVLTTPFCPYAGSMIQQIKDQAESVLEHPVKVTLLAERWDPRDAGLMW